jgi:glycolate oxidase FAD binding subunit
MLTRALQPSTFDQAASALAQAAAEGGSVRVIGGGTKLGWGSVTGTPDVELGTAQLNQIVEHNAGDLTAVLEAGVPLARAQAQFASAGQRLALDPPLAIDPDDEPAATIGGIVATGDSGPLRHRYGSPRDLVLGMTVALSDGTLARSGGKVIKNVAGYDLAKLFAGSFGTLGVILSINVRLHPLPVATATTLGSSGDPDLIGAAVRALAAAPLELEALDIAWRAGRGEILARSGGAEATQRAERVAQLMRESGLELVDIAGDDEVLWDRQRAGQRSPRQALLRIAAGPSRLPNVLRAIDRCGGTLVGRAGMGLSFVEVDPGAVAQLRDGLPPGAASVVLDAPAELRATLDPWGASEGPALELMRRVKARFDPAGACNPGLFVGGI